MIKNESQNAWDGMYPIDDTMFDKYSYFEIRKSINNGETKRDEVKIVLKRIIRDLQNILPTLRVEYYNLEITDFENKLPQVVVYDSNQNDEKNINYFIGVYKNKINKIYEFIGDKDSVIFNYFDCNMSRRLDSEKCKKDGYLDYLFYYWQALRVRIEQKILPNFKEVLFDLNNDEPQAVTDQPKSEQEQKTVETTSEKILDNINNEDRVARMKLKEISHKYKAVKRQMAFKYRPDSSHLENLINQSRHKHTNRFSYSKLGRLLDCHHSTAKKIVERNGLKYLTI